MNRPYSVIAAALLVAFTSLRGVHANPNSPSETPSPSSAPGTEDPAVVRYIEGELHYAAGRYELAVVEFEAALALSAKPELHFNIANCYERAGEYLAAAESLEKFLAGGRAPEPEILRERIWRLKRRVVEQEAAMARLVEQGVKEEIARRPIVKQPVVTLGPSPSKRPAYYTLAAGGALLVTGAVFAGLSSVAGSDAASECIREVCTQDAKDSLDKESRYAKIADITLLAGVAAAGVGTYLWFRSRRKPERRALTVSPIVDSQTVGVWAHARF